MRKGRLVSHESEALVLRTWPFLEADLLVSLFTREQGVLKGVARHAMRSRRRFGGALEPGTQVMAHYTERPGEELVRLDNFDILWSPLAEPMDRLCVAGMQLVLEALEQALPEQAPEDNLYRLAATVLRAMGQGPDPGAIGDSLRSGKKGDGEVWLPITYFCVWMCRLQGWWPDFGHCAVCGLDLGGGAAWWSPVGDGVTCADDQRRNSRQLSAESIRESYRMLRSPLQQLLLEESWPRQRCADLRAAALGTLERHLDRRLRSATAL